MWHIDMCWWMVCIKAPPHYQRFAQIRLVAVRPCQWMAECWRYLDTSCSRLTICKPRIALGGPWIHHLAQLSSFGGARNRCRYSNIFMKEPIEQKYQWMQQKMTRYGLLASLASSLWFVNTSVNCQQLCSFSPESNVTSHPSYEHSSTSAHWTNEPAAKQVATLSTLPILPFVYPRLSPPLFPAYDFISWSYELGSHWHVLSPLLAP